MDVFYTTISIVFGILMPVIIVAVICAIVILAMALPEVIKLKAEEVKKQPPYDEMEWQRNDIDGGVNIVFYKNGTVVYSGIISKKELTEE